jgi:hypothetical protein
MNGRADSPNHWMDAESDYFSSRHRRLAERDFCVTDGKLGRGSRWTSYKIIAGNDGLRKGEVFKDNLFEEKRAKCRNDRSFGLNVEKL